MTKRLGLEIPALVDFPPETKAMVIGSIKLVLRRMRKDGLLGEEISYADLLGDAMRLHSVIGLYKRHREVAADIVVDARGGPAADDQAELVCGITLAQVERLLVFTCAKRLFAGARGTWDGARPEGVLVPEELKRILGFDWQLPLLPLYRDLMTAEHFRVLGDAALALRSPEAVAAVARMNPIDLARIKAAARGRFADVLAVSPDLAALTSELARQPAPAAAVPADREPPRPAPRGAAFPDLGAEAARVLTGLPTAVAAPLMVAFEDVFAADAPPLLRDADFAGDILAGVAANAKRVAESGGDVEEWCRREWSRLRPQILIWMRVRAVR